MIIFLEPLGFAINPEKRIYWLYLISSALIAILLITLKKQPLTQTLKNALGPKVWLHRSSLHDIQWIFLNHFLRIVFVIPILGSALSLSIHINRGLINTFGYGNFWQLPELSISILFTVTMFICNDFSRFLVHYAFHKLPFLWRFHAIHHSANVLTPLTLYRIHWFEMMINSLRSFVVIATVSAIFMYCFENKLNIIDVLGISIFAFLFNIAGSNLRHTSIWLGFGRLEHWIISPAQHQIHHSKATRHIDKNFGACLAVWDRLFGSLLLSQNERVDSFGIANDPNAPQTLHGNFLGYTPSYKQNL